MKSQQRTGVAGTAFWTMALACAAWAAFPAGSRAQSHGAGTSAPAETNAESQAGGKENGGTGEVPQASWNLSPTLAGGATASISGIDPQTGMAFAVDGYYTPYGKDMKGGGFSMGMEGEWIGGRLSLAICQGHMPMGKYKATTTMSYWAADLYLRHALAENLFVYAGVGVAAISYDYEYTVPANRINSSYQVGNSAQSDAMLSCYGGIRWRFHYPLYVFAEYRHDQDADIEIGNVEMTLEGGGRAVVGGGFML